MVVVIEIGLILLNESLPLLISRSNHPVSTVLIVQFSFQEVVVEQVVLLHKYRVEIECLTINQTTSDTSFGNELSPVKAWVIEEASHAVEVGIFAKILKHIGEVLCFSVDGEENTIAVMLVGCQHFTAAESSRSQLGIFTVHHHQRVVAIIC